MLASAPCVNPAVRLTELDTGGIRMVYEKAGGLPIRVLRHLFAIPRTAELVLDGIGSRIVRQMDGKRTVQDLIRFVSGEYNLSRKEAEVALLAYLDRLGRRNLVGFTVAANMGETGRYDE
ncbi:MAG TPA: PqqD family protein [Candidatus Hydrogenedentes bacterium]|nr:PqqD family protein [Candidatus Hydrogenedentota bacterium]HRT18486.1 PqqD family protein [Candidatus Hydrogenedentota bacterium]HRT63505.1 PqqD family protein [Candidatus Hydrogenedentota bacterium]